MATLTEIQKSPVDEDELLIEIDHEEWIHWPVHWNGIWIGALAAVAAVIVLGLIGIALGIHALAPEQRLVDLRKTGVGLLAFSILSAFFAFVLGGWVAAKIAGIRRSEPAMLHGAIAWLVAVPALAIVVSLGAAQVVGGWYAGMGNAAYVNAFPVERPILPVTTASQEELVRYRADLASYNQKAAQWREDTPKVIRNTALGAVTALLLGLMGSVLGGWFASGEPMTFTHHLQRTVKNRAR